MKPLNFHFTTYILNIMASNTTQESYVNIGSNIDDTVDIEKSLDLFIIPLNKLKDKIKDTLGIGKETVTISTNTIVYQEDDELQSIRLWFNILDLLGRLVCMKTLDYRCVLDIYSDEINKLKANHIKSKKLYVQVWIQKTCSVFSAIKKKLALSNSKNGFTNQLFLLKLLCKKIELELDKYIKNKNEYAKQPTLVELDMTNPSLD